LSGKQASHRGLCMVYVLVILGGLLAMALLGSEGAVFGAVIGWLVGKLLRLEGRLSRLAHELEQLQRERSVVQPAESLDAQRVKPPVAAPEAAEVMPKRTPEAPSEVLRTPPEITASMSFEPPDPSLKKPARSDWLVSLTEWLKGYLTGGNLIVRVGVIVLFFGVAFLLKYAAEHSQLPMELRLVGVALGGVLMLGFGWRLRHQRESYALALQGGAVGLLYLTVFAALRLYNLIPASMAFVLLLLFVAFSALLALLQNSRALAVLGSAGGFLAPLLISTGEGSHVALFGYYLLLNGGILAIAWFRAWRILNLLGFGATFVIGSLWGFQFYHSEFFATTEPFLITFFLMYVAVAVLFALRQPPNLRGWVDGSLVFGVPLATAALQAALVKDFEYGLAFSALALGGFYISLAALLFRRGGESLRLLCESFLATGMVFSTLAIPFALEGRLSSAFWALEGAAMIWIGSRQSRLLPRLFGLLLQLLAGLLYLEAGYRIDWGLPLLNSLYLGAALIAFAGIFSAFYLDRHRQQSHQLEQRLVPLLFAWGLLWWLGGNFQEILHFAQGIDESSWLLLLLTATAVGAELLRRRLDWSRLRLVSLGLLPALLLMLVAMGQVHGHYLISWAGLGWVLMFAALYWIIRGLEWDEMPPQLQRYWHAGSFWALCWLLSLEAAWRIDRLIAGGHGWELSVWGLVPLLMVLLATHGGRLLRWPLAQLADLYATAIAAPLVAWLLGWVVVANLTSTGDPRPLAYLPLLNPLDLTMLSVFLLLVKWWQRAGGWLLEQGLVARYYFALLGASLFLWLNGILARTIHHWAGVPFTADALFDSQILQAGLAMLWALLGLVGMVVGHRRHSRLLWLVGAGLMGMVVVKLFLIDLSNTATLARIVAFLGVGALLLLVGYLAPVPPRQPQSESVEEQS